ncbi:MAG: PilZ domain-containing protein [Phycisphaerae bacterium]|nr:PilZ domain-containing protein [Phycisphaerae bacterium]
MFAPAQRDEAMGHEGIAPDGHADVLRLQTEDFRRLLSQLGSVGAAPEGQRWSPRANWSTRALADFFGPTGATSKAVVYPYDLSRQGIGFFHAVFLHTGTKVRLRLWVEDKESIVVEGTVRRCTFVSGRAHAVGVELAAPLPEGILADPAGAGTGPTLAQSAGAGPLSVGAAEVQGPAPQDTPAEKPLDPALVGMVERLSEALNAAQELVAAVRVAVDRAPASSKPSGERSRD